MTEPKKELKGTIIQDEKVHFGERELTNLCWTLIRIYQFRNKNQDPKAIVFPDVKEVDGVRIEFPKAKKVEKQDG